MKIAKRIVGNVLGKNTIRKQNNINPYKVGDIVKFVTNIKLDERDNKDMAVKNSIGIITDIDRNSNFPLYIEFANYNGRRNDVRVFKYSDVRLVRES